jgi:hypothetical protein
MTDAELNAGLADAASAVRDRTRELIVARAWLDVLIGEKSRRDALRRSRSRRPIISVATKKALLRAGFTEYDPLLNSGDACCVGYFSKPFGDASLEVTFWDLPGADGVQVNFETLARDGREFLDIRMRGVPKRWTPSELETYVEGLLKRVRRPRATRSHRGSQDSARR